MSYGQISPVFSIVTFRVTSRSETPGSVSLLKYFVFLICLIKFYDVKILQLPKNKQILSYVLRVSNKKWKQLLSTYLFFVLCYFEVKTFLVC